ncbi:MAG: thiamine pyrophosphate-dependent enzyme [Acidimicrobiales bacterium]
MRTGGELVVACLEAQGVHHTFGVPGESYLAVLDALHDSDMGFVTCRQEGGVTYAAEAWGKLTGEPGIAFVTRGPGATNASVGLHTAMQDSTPMILFVGQASTGHLDREAFQEIDYRAFLGPIVKWATQIDHVERIPEIISRAFATALSGRPGPVVVALPEDVLTASTSASPGRPVRIAEPSPAATQIDEIVALIEWADRPLLLVGGGGWKAEGRAALQRMAEANDLPVAVVFRYLDLIDNHSPSYVGEAGVGMQPHVRELIADADLVLAVGIRFGEMTTAGYTLFDMPDARQTIVHVHPSDGELGKLVQAEVPVHAGPNTFCAILAEAKIQSSATRAAFCASARAARVEAAAPPTQPGELDMAEVMRWLQDALPDDAVITNGAGNFSVWPNKFFSYGPHARILGPQSGSMGYGLPAAIAAKVHDPDREVVCFAGDGDIQMNIQELGTAMQANAQPIVLVINNDMYGTIRMHQEREYPERVSGTEIVNPDYVTLASAYGFHAERIERTSDFPAAYERARASETGALLELMVERTMLTPTMSIDDIRSSS